MYLLDGINGLLIELLSIFNKMTYNFLDRELIEKKWPDPFIFLLATMIRNLIIFWFFYPVLAEPNLLTTTFLSFDLFIG